LLSPAGASHIGLTYSAHRPLRAPLVRLSEINHAGVGGLYAERIQNSAFETMLNTYAPWAPSPSNPSAAPLKLSLSQDRPLTWQSPTSLRVDSTVSDGKMYTVGISNPGFWGVSTVGVSAFNVSLFASSATVASVTVSVTDRTGATVYGSATLKGVSSSWSKLSAIVSVKAEDPAAVFSISWMTMQPKDTVYFDVVSCLPAQGWHGLPYIRADLAEHIAALHPAFVRFPGGCYVEGDSLTDRFNW
jgi:alpha-N-arabinofuranosidase